MTPEDKNKHRRTQEERRSEAENALLDAAEELIGEQGIQKTSLAQIGERAGYSRGLVNHHFGTKDALVERLVWRARQKFFDSLDLGREESGLETILRAADAYIAKYEKQESNTSAVMVLWGTAFARNANHIKAIVETDVMGREILVDAVTRGKKDGSVSTAVDTESFATWVMGMLKGISAQMVLEPEAVNLKKLRAEIKRSMLAVLGASQ